MKGTTFSGFQMPLMAKKIGTQKQTTQIYIYIHMRAYKPIKMCVYVYVPKCVSESLLICV